jgi:diguanylate cyclase (GGDEF)-like protein
MVPVLLLVVGVLTASAWQLVDRALTAEDDARLDAIAERIAPVLRDRIEVADAWVVDLAGATHEERGLHRRVADSHLMAGVVLEPWAQAFSGDGAAGSPLRLPRLTTAQQDALLGGRSVLLGVPLSGAGAGGGSGSGSGSGIYLAHPLALSGGSEIGFFELSPVWLWQGFDTLPQQDAVAVIAAGGVTLFNSARWAAWTPAMLLRSIAGAAFHGDSPLRRGWQQQGRAWRAALLSVDWDETRVNATGAWLISAYGLGADPTTAMLSLLPGLLVALALGIAMLLLASRWAVRGWQPALARVHVGLASLRAGAFQRAEATAGAGVAGLLAQTYDLAIDELQQRLAGQACLAEIDRLLLEAGELEQVLDPILMRVRSLTGSQVVAVAMLDHDAPAHARCFISGAEGGDSPVNRVNIDEDLALQLQGLAQALSVPAHHLERYSFLAPLQEQGASSCCAWPIMAGERLGAILVVGYRDPAPPTREQLALAAECAARLRFALTHAERGEHLYRQAHFDSLTALPNRVLFRDRLAEELRHAADSGQRSALLYVDLDHFKRVNDSVGHVGGDQLLTIVAQRLRGCVKDEDTVARLGGDEFTVILRNLPSAAAAGDIAERIIEVLQRPVNLAGRDHHVRASIGITVFPDDGNTLETVMRNADLAMYQAKDAGRARAVFFDSQMTRAHSPIAHSGLYRALRRREFALHYQPQFHLGSGAVAAVEALLRWPSPQQGMRFPRDFLPAAEESGLIVDLGAWVLESACRQLALWREEGIAPARLALNVSVQQLRLADYPQLVHQALECSGLPAGVLELDFTEAALAEERPRLALRALADQGVRLALDDFGAGYASLNHLRQHPIDAIKLDGSFMQEVPDDSQAALLAATIIDMAHALDKQVIAEGVETLAQLDFLREHGCDLAQGYVLARPMTVDEISAVLTAHRGSPLPLQDAAG